MVMSTPGNRQVKVLDVRVGDKKIQASELYNNNR